MRIKTGWQKPTLWLPPTMKVPWGSSVQLRCSTILIQGCRAVLLWMDRSQFNCFHRALDVKIWSRGKSRNNIYVPAVGKKPSRRKQTVSPLDYPLLNTWTSFTVNWDFGCRRQSYITCCLEFSGKIWELLILPFLLFLHKYNVAFESCRNSQLPSACKGKTEKKWMVVFSW